MELATSEALNRFLAGVEVRAYRMAEFSIGDADEALDLVQDAMLGFVSRYADKPEAEWNAIFYRILQNRITDWYRRTAVRNKFRAWFGNSDDDGDGKGIRSRPSLIRRVPILPSPCTMPMRWLR